MFKLVLIAALIAVAYCAPADKDKSDHLEPSETSWNAGWANPGAAPNAWQNQNAWGANRWNNQADPRWNRWGGNSPDAWNRWGGNPGWNQWNRAGSWPAAGGAAATAAGANRGWNPW